MKYVFGLLCVLGVLLPMSMLIPWININGLNLVQLYIEISSDKISAFAWLDVVVSAVVLIAFIVHEGKKQKMSRLWMPIVATLSVGVSFGFPLFLLMRELQLEKSETLSKGQRSP